MLLGTHSPRPPTEGSKSRERAPWPESLANSARAPLSQTFPGIPAPFVKAQSPSPVWCRWVWGYVCQSAYKTWP